MLRSEAERHLIDWFNSESKVYKHIQEFLPIEYIVICKKTEDLYECLPNASNKDIGKMDKDTFLKKLHTDELVYYENFKYHVDYKNLRNGGCDCGAWATSNPNNHSFKCKKR